VRHGKGKKDVTSLEPNVPRNEENYKKGEELRFQAEERKKRRRKGINSWLNGLSQ